MKVSTITVFICLFFTECNHSQEPCDMKPEAMHVEAKRIMKILEIPMRTSFAKDDTTVYWLPNAQMRGPFAGFNFDKQHESAKPSQVFYTKPRIEFSEEMFRYLRKEPLAGDRINGKLCVHANAAIIHELTHYYQTDSLAYYGRKYVKGTPFNKCEYIYQQVEFEAFAVMAYYFMSIENKEELKEILAWNTTRKERCEALVKWWITHDRNFQDAVCDPR